MCAVRWPSPNVCIYRVKRSTRVNAVLFLVLGPVVASISHGISGAAFLLLFGAYVAASVFRTALTLAGETIELRTLFARKALRFDNILGRREYVAATKYGGRLSWKIVPNENRLPTLKFDSNLEFDGEFREWFESLPDLDAIDKLKLKYPEVS